MANRVGIRGDRAGRRQWQGRGGGGESGVPMQQDVADLEERVGRTEERGAGARLQGGLRIARKLFFVARGRADHGPREGDKNHGHQTKAARARYDVRATKATGVRQMRGRRG